ncbi:hypothetical protein OROMI_017524 [Orobanche minor]
MCGNSPSPHARVCCRPPLVSAAVGPSFPSARAIRHTTHRLKGGKQEQKQAIATLSNTVRVQNTCLIEMETKYKETSISLSSLIGEKDAMVRHFNEDRD